jgi:adenylate cyclase
MGANALCMFGDTERARDWIGRALLLDPDNLSMRYNLACSLALELNDPNGALNALEPYFERVKSRTHIRHLEADPDLDAIRKDPRFQEKLSVAKERLGMTEPAANA